MFSRNACKHQGFANTAAKSEAVFACNKLGVLFSNSTYSEFNPPPENNFAHVYTDSIITDTTNWFTIAGSFVADSTYSNIILGIFFDNNNVDTLRLFKPNCDVFAYYFIDDVSVTPSNPNAIADAQPFAFKAYPNPFTGKQTLALVPNSQILPMSFQQYDEFLASHKVIKNTNNAIPKIQFSIGNKLLINERISKTNITTKTM